MNVICVKIYMPVLLKLEYSLEKTCLDFLLDRWPHFSLPSNSGMLDVPLMFSTYDKFLSSGFIPLHGKRLIELCLNLWRMKNLGKLQTSYILCKYAVVLELLCSYFRNRPMRKTTWDNWVIFAWIVRNWLNPLYIASKDPIYHEAWTIQIRLLWQLLHVPYGLHGFWHIVVPYRIYFI